MSKPNPYMQEKRIAELERRVAELEAGPVVIPQWPAGVPNGTFTGVLAVYKDMVQDLH